MFCLHLEALINDSMSPRYRNAFLIVSLSLQSTQNLSFLIELMWHQSKLEKYDLTNIQGSIISVFVLRNLPNWTLNMTNIYCRLAFKGNHFQSLSGGQRHTFFCVGYQPRTLTEEAPHHAMLDSFWQSVSNLCPLASSKTHIL